MDRAADFSESQSVSHRQAKLANQISRIGRNYRRAQYRIGSALQVDPNKAVCFSIENSPVGSFQFLCKSVHCNSLLTGLLFVQPNVGNFR